MINSSLMGVVGVGPGLVSGHDLGERHDDSAETDEGGDAKNDSEDSADHVLIILQDRICFRVAWRGTHIGTA
jgi:hypothetical protein